MGVKGRRRVEASKEERGQDRKVSEGERATCVPCNRHRVRSTEFSGTEVPGTARGQFWNNHVEGGGAGGAQAASAPPAQNTPLGRNLG